MAKAKYHLEGLNGQQASEVVSGLISAASMLWQLEALYKAILRDIESKASNTKELAKLGAYVACDIANLSDCIVEGIENGEVA